MKKKSCNFGIDWGNVGSKAYSGTADFGKDYTYITTFITLLICLILLVTGIVFMFKKSVYTQQATMTITQDSVLINDGSSKMSYTTYGTVDGCKQEPVTVITSDPYTSGDKITVYQDPSNACNVADKPVPYKMIGGFMIGFAVIIGGFSLINLYFVKKYKGVAAVEGVAGVFNLFRR